MKMVVDESPTPTARQGDCNIDEMDSLDFRKRSVASQDDTSSPSPSTGEDSTMTPDSVRETAVFLNTGSTSGGSRLRRLREADRLRGSLHDSSHHSTRTYGSNHEGYSGYATKPTEFVSPHSMTNRRSWRPKDTSSSLASPKRGYSCPISGPSLTKTGTAQVHEADTMEGITPNQSHLPPLSRRSTHGKQSQPSTASELHQISSHSASGDQINVTSSSGIPRKVRSWKPKATPSTPSSPDDRMKTSNSQMPLSYLPIIPLDASDHYSSSSPLSNEKPVASLPSPKIWTRHESDPSLLPPAFQASLASPRRTPAGGYQRRTIDISRIECVSPMAKEKPKVGKLIYQWPPTQDAYGNSNRAQFLRTLGALSIKELSAAFEKHIHQSSMLESSTMTAIDIVMRMVQDTAHHVVTDDDSPEPIPPNSEEHTRIIEAVDKVLQDEHLLSAIWAASSNMDEGDEDWTCTGLSANLSETERREVISNVVKVMQDKAVLAGVWARSSPPDASVTDTQAIIGDFRWQTSVKIQWSGPVHRDDEGVPLCFRGSYEDAKGDKLPLAPLLRDRFGDLGQDLPLSTVKRSPSFTLEPLLVEDRFGIMPTDLPPAGIKRSRCSLNEAHPGSPVVWVARWCISDDPSEDEKWMVTRVWDDPLLDEKETRHQVSRGELMKKVKELLGIPMDDTTSASIDNALYDAEVEDWCIQKVYDLNGKIQASSKTMKVDEHGMIRCFDEIDQAAGISSMARKAMTAEDAKVIAVSMQNSRLEPSKSPNAREIDRNITVESTHTLEAKPANRTNHDKSDGRILKKAARKEKKETKKEKKQTNGPRSIWDLLSPPPVFILVDPPPES